MINCISHSKLLGIYIPNDGSRVIQFFYNPTDWSCDENGKLSKLTQIICTPLNGGSKKD